MNYFKKAAVFTDLHLGLKSNSNVHNTDCGEYIDWFIDTAKSKNCDTVIFCGDWNHQRNAINITTLNYGVDYLEKIGKSFDQTIFFLGNHDLYYKDRRDVNSILFGKHIPGIQMISEPIVMDNVAFVPWLIGDEWKKIKKLKCQYMFGHFELPTFLMNAMVQMPDHGELKTDDFKGIEYVFTGHFHKRQNKDNIHYIGNAFPHNFADAWDDERGMMILEWGGKPEYYNWDNMPRYRTITLSKLIDEMDTILKPKMYLRVQLDIDISFEEASFIKETVMSNYDIRECVLIAQKKSLEDITPTEIVNFKSVDQIVSNQIININSDSFDSKVLMEIYSNL
jgi:DNA repair exonuclease SbcCD nuclease subunit